MGGSGSRNRTERSQAHTNSIENKIIRVLEKINNNNDSDAPPPIIVNQMLENEITVKNIAVTLTPFSKNGAERIFPFATAISTKRLARRMIIYKISTKTCTNMICDLRIEWSNLFGPHNPLATTIFELNQGVELQPRTIYENPLPLSLFRAIVKTPLPSEEEYTSISDTGNDDDDAFVIAVMKAHAAPIDLSNVSVVVKPGVGVDEKRFRDSKTVSSSLSSSAVVTLDVYGFSVDDTDATRHQEQCVIWAKNRS